MASIREEFEMYIKTFIDFEREVLVEVQNGETRLSSALTITGYDWKQEDNGPEYSDCKYSAAYGEWLDSEDRGVRKVHEGTAATGCEQNAGTLLMVTQQQGVELEWVIHFCRFARDGRHFTIKESGGALITFLFYELFSEEDPYWE